MRVSFTDIRWVNTFLVMFTHRMSANVYSFWQKWWIAKLKEGKQMLTSLVNKCLFSQWVNKQQGIYYIPLFTQGVYFDNLP